MAGQSRPVRRKTFKAERTQQLGLDGTSPGNDAGLSSYVGDMYSADGERHQEVLNAIETLRSEMFALARKEPPQQQAGIDLDTFKSQIQEAERLKTDLRELKEAIEQTKVEIVQLRRSDRVVDKIETAGEALRAVVSDTEQATDGIINSVEAIEEICGRLVSQAGSDGQGLADALNEQVTAIFEHCNFQDITGQRITKVVNTMEFIDERIARMMEIWGGQEVFAEIEVDETESRPEGEILDGPALPGQSISQEDIDALFD